MKTIHAQEKIQQALIALINQKSLENITITDITRTAKINRGTFYLYYQDKHDLLSQIEIAIMDNLMSMDDEFKLILTESSTIEQFVKAQKPFTIQKLQYLRKERGLINAMISSHGDPAFIAKVQNYFREFYFNLDCCPIIASCLIASDPIIPDDYRINIITSGIFSTVLHWLEKDTQETPEQIADIINSILFTYKFVGL